MCFGGEGSPPHVQGPGVPLADPTRRLRPVVEREGEPQDFMLIKPQKT